MIKFQELFSALNKSKVRYLVAGGIAVNLYGIERATADIDLVVDLEENNLERFINAIKELGLKPKVSLAKGNGTPKVPVRLVGARCNVPLHFKEKRERWVIEKDMRVFSIFDPKNPYLLLDVFVEEPFNFKKVFEARKEMMAGKTIIPVVPLKDLIEVKEKTGRPQDIADAFYLKKIKEEWKDEGWSLTLLQN